MPEEKKEKVTLDDKELSIDKSSQKVELDLDDAPFLVSEEEKKEEKKEEEEAPSQEPKPSEEAEEDVEEKVKKIPIWKKWWFLASIVLLLVVLSAIFIMLKSKKPPQKVESPEKPKEIVKPEKPPPPPKEKVTLAPFWLEYGKKKNVRWLHVQFMLVVSGRFVLWEISRKKMLLRDAIYYYFRNKELPFLTDKNNIKRIKEDLKAILNQYLSKGKVDNILIQKYLLE